MQPGRELDLLVAQQVMQQYWQVDGVPAAYLTGLRHYSTEISAAWEVVEKMKVQQIEYFSILKYPAATVPWTCRIITQDNTRYSATGNTAPHAMCLASLKAMGVYV